LGWCERELGQVTGLRKKGLDSLLSLGAWLIWNHRNRVVFDGVAPSLSLLLQTAHEEREKWQVAGAKGLSFLAALLSTT
jgi:hypothetical protein